MNQTATAPISTADLPDLGQPFQGGILAAVGYRLDGTKYAIATAKKDDDAKMTWDEAMAFCASLGEGWSLPTLENGALLRANCMPATYVDFPAQTQIEAFKEGGPQAFETDEWYWLQEQASAHDAWCQNFYYGNQYYLNKYGRCRVRAVRQIDLI
jgi:hypothetical protein